MVLSYTREIFNPWDPNTYFLGLAATSLVFNTTLNGRLLAKNFFTNGFLMYTLWLANGCVYGLHEPVVGAKLGLLASVVFTAGLPLRFVYTQRLFQARVHYAIGLGLITYNGLQLYHNLTFFEDAMEDGDDEM